MAAAGAAAYAVGRKGHDTIRTTRENRHRSPRRPELDRSRPPRRPRPSRRILMPTAPTPAELLRALGALCEPPEPEHRRLGRLLGLPGAADAAAHTELFLLELHPYASVYLGAEGMLGGEARDRVAGFWRAVGRRPPPEPDHLTSLLSLYASLVEEAVEVGPRQAGSADPAGEDGAGRRVLLGRARKALLWEHLLSWLGPWLSKAEEIAPPFYAAWADLLRGVLFREAAGMGPPEKLPLHFREVSGLGDPRGGEGEAGSPGGGGSEAPSAAGEAFLRSVLAAVRSGILITRRDLRRAGRSLALGVRKGERLYALRALLEQDAPATLDWLAGEARSWAGRHARLWTEGEPSGAAVGALTPVARWWRQRAESAAELLATLAEGAVASEERPA